MRMTINRHVVILGSLVTVLAMGIGPVRAADDPPEAPDFNRDVLPILTRYCLGCHNADDAESELVLATYTSLLEGGQRGAAILPGQSDSSRLVRVLVGEAEPVMPPEDSQAPGDDEIAVLRRWIDAGAKGPQGAAPDPNRLIIPQVDPAVTPREPIVAAAFAPDGKSLALATYGEVRLVAVDSRAVTQRLVPHVGQVNDVRFSADGSQLIAASGQPGLFGEATIWNLAELQPLRRIRGHNDSLYAAALSPEGRLLATSSYDRAIKIWDSQTGDELHTLSAHNGAVYDLAFHPGGRLLASASADRTVKIWNVESGERVVTLGQSLKELNTVAFRPDGTQLAAAGVDNRIRVWRIPDGSGDSSSFPLIHARFAHEDPILALAYSPGGASLASSSEDGSVKLWNAETLEERHLLETQPDWPAALAFSPDGVQLAVGRLDGSYELYNVENGKPIPPARPELAATDPRGIRRGQSTTVRISGKYLLGASSIEFDNEQIATKVLDSESAQAAGEELLAEIEAAADLPRGEYKLAVRTPGGVSEKLAIYVDDLPQVAESEPNDATSQASSARLPATLWGTIATAGDSDVFAFEAAEGQRLVFALTANFNGVLAALGPEGRLLASNNDFDGERNPLLVLDVPVTGRYHVRVADLTASGSAKHWYRLSAGELSYVTGIYPLSLAADKTGEVELAGYNLPPDARVGIESPNEGRNRVPIDSEEFRGHRDFHVVASAMPERLEDEPNDLPSQATRIEAPCVVGGRAMPTSDKIATDTDLFRFEAAAGQRWVIETEAARLGSPIDTQIDVLDAGGNPVPRLALQAVRDSVIEFRGIDANTGDVRVSNWEEMELNEYLYFQGEVCKIFRLRRGPDSGFLMYSRGGKRIGYFDTSATAHGLDEPCYIVVPRAPGAELLPTGLPVFTLTYSNDDDGGRRLGRDSRILFTAPDSGEYLVRVRDVRGAGGDRFAYRLILRRPKPDFSIRIGGANPEVPAGGGRTITFTAERIDGFDGPIQVDITDLPPGFAAPPTVVIQQGHTQAQIVLHAQPDAVAPDESQNATSKVTASAIIAGSEISKDIGSLGKITLADKGRLRVWLEPAEIVLAPGTTVEAKLRVERNGFDERISFELFNMPHGVIVDNIGLNGVLIRPGETQRQVFLSARDWVPETSRMIHAVATEVDRESSPPIELHIRGAEVVARADGSSGE